jgi:HlyD family secretion protein/adhesin transport system membrane fusion protein
MTQTAFDPSDGPARRLLGWSAGVIVAGLVGAFIWSVLANVDEVARARGQVEPLEQVQRVESQHGGVLEELLIRRDDRVQQGQVIARLNPVEARSGLGEAERRAAALTVELERLLAFIDGRGADHRAQAEAYPVLVAQSQAALLARRSAVETQEREAGQRVAAKVAELAAIEAQLPAVTRQLTVAREATHTIAALVERGLAPRPRLVDLIEQEARFAVDLAQLNGRKTMGQAELLALQASQERIRRDEVSRARERAAELQGLIRVNEAQQEALRARLAGTELRSPVTGIVQSLPETRTGDVIEPGGLIARIVPAGGVRFVARLAPRDVGFVHVGQMVRLKTDSFDFSRFGALPGTVERISPTTNTDERGTAFYEVLVRIERTYYRDDAARFGLSPGMTGEADIITGRRSVFAYLWQPLVNQFDLALAER